VSIESTEVQPRFRKFLAGLGLVIRADAESDVETDLVIRRKFVTIPAASVQIMNATPYEVIAAPGAGRFIEVISAHWWLDFGTAAYDAAAAGDTLELKYTNGAGAALTDAVAGNAIGAAAADYHTTVKGVPEVIPVANAAVVAHINAGEWYGAAGDSPLKVEVLYIERALEPAE
jgi:hypothetical protein